MRPAIGAHGSWLRRCSWRRRNPPFDWPCDVLLADRANHSWGNAMLKCPTRCALALGLVIGLGPTTGKPQEINVILALPAATLTFSAPFLAEDAGFFKREGLKVSVRNIVGVGSVNAVLAGSADFTMGTGPVFLRAAAQGQRMYAIANLVDRPLVEMVLRKDVAEAAGITDKTPFAERAKALKGKTIGIQG